LLGEAEEESCEHL